MQFTNNHCNNQIMKPNQTSTTVFLLLPGICYLTEFIVWSLFPQSRSLNAVLGGLWSLGQIGILVSLWNLYKWKIADGSKWKIAGVSIAAAGAISYLINYCFGYWLHMNTRVLLPLGALLTGVGMIIVGIQVIAGRRWQGLASKFPLLVGLYPFLVMFPLLILQGRPDLTAIMGWGLPWLALGLAMNAEERRIFKMRPW
jgi:hypothetical protein